MQNVFMSLVTSWTSLCSLCKLWINWNWWMATYLRHWTSYQEYEVIWWEQTLLGKSRISPDFLKHYVYGAEGTQQTTKHHESLNIREQTNAMVHRQRMHSFIVKYPATNLWIALMLWAQKSEGRYWEPSDFVLIAPVHILLPTTKARLLVNSAI